MITTVGLQTQRAGFMARLWMSCCGDLAAYGDGLIRDFRALTADLVAAWLLVAVVVLAPTEPICDQPLPTYCWMR